MKILIDNGHGENTPGKRSPDGRLLEYKYAREIAERVVTELRRRGYDAERLVTESIDVSLMERVRRVNEMCGRYGSKNVLCVSVHCNAAGNGDWMKARGWSVYTSPGKTRGDDLATSIYEAATDIFSEDKSLRLRHDYSDGDPDWEENFYILRKTKCAACLTENFFQDNREDVDYLLSQEGKAAITAVHVNGIINYIKKIQS